MPQKMYMDERILTTDIFVEDAPDDFVRLVNIYAPANGLAATTSRSRFWKDIPTEELYHTSMIVVGDFNIVCDPYLDRMPPMNERQRVYTVAPWYMVQPMVDHLELSDTAARNYDPVEDENIPIDDPDRLWFTLVHDRGEAMTLTRIDYIFVSTHMHKRTSRYKVETCEGKVSDHRMVSVTINSSRTERNHALPSIDVRILPDPIFQKQIRSNLVTLLQTRQDNPQKWSTPSAFWEFAKKEILRLGLSFAKKRRQANRQQQQDITNGILECDKALERDPSDMGALREKTKKQQEAVEYQARRMDHVALMSKVKYLEEGEKASPFFTKRLISSQRRKQIDSLRNDDGHVSEDPKVIASIARKFYERLYSSEDTSVDAQETLLTEIRTQVPEEAKTRLDSDLTLVEITSAIRSMAYRSSPGSDGIPYEFYKHFSKEVTPLLLEVFNAITATEGVLPKSHRHSLTTLLYKKGDADEIKNYRPISLTQCDYKIFTKVLTNRINPVADHLIGEWQTGFIPGRQGHDNVLILDLVASALHKGDRGHGALLSLDQEKAYDRVEWSYLHRVLDRFGFGPRLRGWIKACYTNLFATITLRGKQSERYNVFRGLRQGDPLAPILFNFVLEPFLLYYNSHAVGCLQGPSAFRVSAFADDTTLGMGPRDKRVALKAIDLHEQASGAKVNVQKTEIIPLTEASARLMAIPGYLMKDFEAPFTHLGVVIQPGGRNIAVIENDILLHLRRSAQMMFTRRLSFTGKITVLNTYLLSKIWHVAPFYDFSSSFYEQIDKICKRLLWNSGQARVNLAWFQRPKSEGGYGLIHVQHQVIALKAKFMARMAVSEPKWHDLFILAAQEAYDFTTPEQTKAYLRRPRWRDPVDDTPIQEVLPLIEAYSSLEPKRAIVIDETTNRAVNELVAAGKTPVRMYKVQTARRFLDEKYLAVWANEQTNRKIYLRPPISIHMRWTDDHYNSNIPTVTLSDEEWHTTWARMHSKHRQPKEKEFMFMLSHRVIFTNGVKALFDGLPRPVEPHCRRCPPIPPSLVAPIESRRHAFYECVIVQEEWTRMHKWIHEIFPNILLPSSLLQDTMCWPAIPHLPPLIIHLHSTVMFTIWRTYCALGDGEILEPEELRWKIVHAFKARVKAELSRAHHKKLRAAQRPQARVQARVQPRAQAGGDSDGYDPVGAAIKIWHHPPFIEMTRDGVSMGDLWFQT